MIPLHDDVPTVTTPVVTVGLILACTVAFLWQQTLPDERQVEILFQLGVVPAALFGHARLPPGLALVAPEWTILTSMFLHGGWLHIIGNMLYLWIFGNNVEDAMGHVRFVIFYLLCGTAAALVQSWQDPSSRIPMIGASGAIAGVLGAYLVLHPRARVLVLIPLGFFSQVVRIPALIVLGLWFVMQFVFGAMTPLTDGGVAYWAHVGGFVAGLVLVLPFRRRAAPQPAMRRRGPWGPRG
jgi:membrane associated rhomboid family serine protease